MLLRVEDFSAAIPRLLRVQRPLIPVFPDMKLWALWISWARALPSGKWGSVSVLAGTVDGHTTAFTTDGGYAEYMVAYEDGLILIPDEISAEEAAPLLCAGETTFSALHNSKARIGDLIAVSGIGGLGHLAVQYAKKAGYEVVAISHGTDKEQLAHKLGAHHYIDSEKENPGEALKALGGSKVIIATASNEKSISSLMGGLGTDGELIIAAVSDEPLEWSAMDFLMGPNTVKGTFTDIKEMEAAVRFSILTDVRPMIEVFPLEQAREAYEKMMAAKTHFRAVLSISQ